MSTSAVVDKSARAQGRWKLLRQALLQNNCNMSTTSNHDCEHSIHRFEGYKMLPTTHVTDSCDWKENLLSIHVAASDSIACVEACVVQQIIRSVAALAALSERQASITIHFADDSILFDPSCLELQKMHSSHVKLSACQYTRCVSDQTVCVNVEFATSQQHSVKEYRISDHLCVLTREPIQRVVSLDQLIRTDIDNTGNICVWDCSMTLTWALHRQQQQSHRLASVKTVLELGSGMAGLASLSLANTAETVYVTDGHSDSVFHNQVNVRLMEAAKRIRRSSNIKCFELKWTTDVERNACVDQQAELTVIADCTHFQTYHACLFWTAVRYTTVQGQIWMCQPARGSSWQRFLNLVEAVNENKSDSVESNPLVTIIQLRFDELEHRHFRLTNEDPKYDADIHQPLISVLQLLRKPSLSDLHCAIKHVEDRDR